MNIAGEIRAGRRLAERLMIDTLRVTRASTEPPIRDPATGTTTSPPPDLIYEGKGKIQTYEANEAGISAGGKLFTVQRYKAHLPVGVGPFQVDDLVTVAKARLDPHLAGNKFTMVGPMNKTAATAQRIQVDEVPK